MICSTRVGICTRLRSHIGLASLVLILVSGCSLRNPGFHGSSASESESAGPSTSTTATSSGTSGMVSTGSAASGGESEGSSSGALTLTGGSSTGTTGTSSSTSNGSTSSTSSTSTGADTEGSTSDSGGPQTMTLRNYSSLDSCKVGPWCANDENQPAKVRHATIECFHSDIAPFEITKLTVHPRKIRGNPTVSIWVYDFDGQTVGSMIMEKDVGAVGPDLAPKELLFNPPVPIAKQDFCVGYKTAPGNTQLAAFVDKNGSNPGVSLVRMFGTPGCTSDFHPLTDLYAQNPRFCFDVEIAAQ